jgi:hypothetical protein
MAEDSLLDHEAVAGNGHTVFLFLLWEVFLWIPFNFLGLGIELDTYTV